MNNSNDSVEDKKYFELGLKHKYLYFRRTKIAATIGPASSSPEILKQLILKGLNVARINFSHGRPEDHLRTTQSIRKFSAQLRMPVVVLGGSLWPQDPRGQVRQYKERDRLKKSCSPEDEEPRQANYLAGLLYRIFTS